MGSQTDKFIDRQMRRRPLKRKPIHELVEMKPLLMSKKVLQKSEAGEQASLA